MAAVTQPASQQMGLPFSFERERREGEREREERGEREREERGELQTSSRPVGNRADVYSTLGATMCFLL